MDIIKALKENEKPICLLSDELYAKMRTLPDGSLECLQELSDLRGPKWALIGEVQWSYVKGRDIYRLRADYQEDEYELCEIVGHKADLLQFCDSNLNPLGTIADAPNFPEFAGYLYEDQVLEGNSVRYFHGNVETSSVDFDDIKSGDATILRPTRVVFKKG